MFTTPLTPRYLEVDQLGVVFNMWYLAYFDDAMTAFLAAGGHPYPQLRADGFDVMLVRTELDWTAGLAYGDAAEVAVGVERVGRTSFVLRFDVRRGGEVTCRGRTVYVMVALPDNATCDVPGPLRTWLDANLLPADDVAAGSR